jgi:Domain of unknown function (DUF4412)
MTAKTLTALALGATAAALAALPVAADTLLTMSSHHDAYEVGGQSYPAEDATTEIWLGEGRIRRDDGKTGAILRADDNELILVHHPSKTYSLVKLPIDFAAMVPAQARPMLEMWKVKTAVTATDESKKIGDWTARRYDVEVTNAMGLAVHTELWASRDVPIDYDRFAKLSLTLASLQPGGADAAGELAKVEGFPVLQETTMDLEGHSLSTSEKLVSVEQRDAPAGTYDPPAGYTEKEFNPMAPPGGPGG